MYRLAQRHRQTDDIMMPIVITARKTFNGCDCEENKIIVRASPRVWSMLLRQPPLSVMLCPDDEVEARKSLGRKSSRPNRRRMV